TDLPNQYVYGYALISYATQKYGEDVWRNIIADVAEFPQPFRLYSSFEKITGQSFKLFYLETMDDLRKKWAKDAPEKETVVDYREEVAPYKVGDALYFVKNTLDDQSRLLKSENGKMSEVAELHYNKDFMKLNVGQTKAVYTEFLPDARYGQKGSSRLVVLDLATGKKSKITDDLRIYYPSLNDSETKIIATDFKDDQTWNLVEFDLQGNLLETFSLPEGKVAEAQYLDNDSAAVILNSKTGYRSLVIVDLKTKKVIKTLLSPSRNVITSLFVDKNKNLLFEAQYKGGNDIFKVNGNGLARCTTSKLGAFTPSSDGQNVYYSNMDTYGAQVASVALDSCQKFQASDLVDFKYIGDSPSDNYNRFPVTSFPAQESLFTKNATQYKSEEYGDFDKRLAIPHTWGLWLGRGGGLAVESDNLLRTMSAMAQVGTDPEEGQSFFGLSFDLKKYYPLFTLSAEQRHRKVTDFDTDIETKWTEKSVGLSMDIPYIKKTGVYNFQTGLSLGGGYTDTSEYEINDSDVDGTNYFYKSFAQLAFAWSKDAHTRSLMNPWLLSYRVRYDNAEQPTDSRFSGNRSYQQAIAQTPGFASNDGFMVSWDQQKQEDALTAYRFLPERDVPGSYAFSRGYSYEDVPGYQKVSGNYLFPIAYPDWDLGNWYYLRRMSGTLFFDSTVVDDTQLDSVLNSYGAELKFESKFFRILPVTFGVRVLQRLLDNEVRGDLFLATGLEF
ncbi:MAG: hypothetical protein J7501_11940, partial [Bdellovibrio sp.]|nr:hypothetical protein [Bdellovibrio sp.]